MSKRAAVSAGDGAPPVKRPRDSVGRGDDGERAATLVADEELHPGVARRHACSEALCGADFASPGKLRRHIEGVHLGLKPHACSQCEAVFTEADKLRRHVSAVHLGL